MLKRALLVAACAAVAGCHPGGGPGPVITEVPDDVIVAPTYQEFAVSAATEICDIEALNTERSERVEEMRSLAYIGRDDQGRQPVTRRTETEEVSDAQVIRPQPAYIGEKTEILRLFETDLDAAYRFAAAACRTHVLCLQSHGFEEGRCMTTGNFWAQAQDNFVNVTSINAMQVRQNLAQSQILEEPRTIIQEVRPPEEGARRAQPRCGSNVLGDVFTSGACGG